MQEIERYGLKIAICQTFGGIWRDKGELEKIIMMIREDAPKDGGGHGASTEEAYYDEPCFL